MQSNAICHDVLGGRKISKRLRMPALHFGLSCLIFFIFFPPLTHYIANTDAILLFLTRNLFYTILTLPLLKLHSAIVFLEILYFMDLKAFSLSAELLKGMWTSKLRILLYYVLDQYFTSH